MNTQTQTPIEMVNRSSGPGAPPNYLLSFQGRIPRATFWAMWSFLVIMNIVVFLLIFGIAQFSSIVAQIFAFLNAVFNIWALLAMQVKRWHDIGYTGWLAALTFIPLANIVAFLVLCIVKGTTGQNRFGDDPL